MTMLVNEIELGLSHSITNPFKYVKQALTVTIAEKFFMICTLHKDNLSLVTLPLKSSWWYP